MGMSDVQLAKAQNLHRLGKLTEAMMLYQHKLKSDPHSDIALDGLGLAYLQRGRAIQAIPLMILAIDLRPSFHHYHYHLAEAYSENKQSLLAIKAYKRAIQLCPNVADYHFSLGNVLTEMGKLKAAIRAFRQALVCSPDDAEAHNNMANNLADVGHIDEARQHLEQALKINPEYAEAHVNLARLYVETGDRGRAMLLCEKAVSIDPGLYEAHLDLGLWRAVDARTQQQALSSFQNALRLRPGALEAKQGLADTLLKLDLPQAALPLYQEVVASADASAHAYLGLSHCLIRLQQFSSAERMAAKAIEASPDLSEAYLNLGICMQAQGRFKAASDAHYEALNRNPELTEAAYHLAILDPQTVAKTSGFKRAIKRLTEHRLAPEKQAHLLFALGKLAERESNYEVAFAHFQQGNLIKSDIYPFDEKQYHAYTERIMATFTVDFFRDRKGFGLTPESPIFIVGMPRSGSTLLEKILNAHPHVCGIGEHREMREITRELPALIASDQRVPECVSDMTEPQSRSLAQRYLDSWPESLNGFERVVDKMLGNFLRLGLIALLFPHARIIHCQRQALDTCLSCHTQDFAAGLRFTACLGHLGLVYKSHLQLMAHWRQVLPLRMTQVNYEDLVGNTENCTRALIEFCGLPWDQACMQHHVTKSNVATASFMQVRQPVYRQSVGKWKSYEPWLAELIEALK